MSYDLLIRGKHNITTLQKLVGHFFETDPIKIGSIYDLGQEDHEINIEIYDTNGDFETRLCVYKSDHILPKVKEIDFALFLSFNLNKDVLMTYWDINPYLWILVKPNGQLFRVNEIPNQDKSKDSHCFFLELDETTQKELNLIEVRNKLNY